AARHAGRDISRQQVLRGPGSQLSWTHFAGEHPGGGRDCSRRRLRLRPECHSNRCFLNRLSRKVSGFQSHIAFSLHNSPIIQDMIYLDSYGTSLLLDTATPEGLTEWDRLESRLRESSNSQSVPSRPLRINAT